MSQECEQEPVSQAQDVPEKLSNGEFEDIPLKKTEIHHNGHDHDTQNGDSSGCDATGKNLSNSHSTEELNGEDADKLNSSQSDAEAEPDELLLSVEFTPKEPDTESVVVEVGSLAAPESLESGIEEFDSSSECDEQLPVGRRTRSAKTKTVSGKII